MPLSYLNEPTRSKRLAAILDAQPYVVVVAIAATVAGIAAILTGNLPTAVDEVITAPWLRALWALYLLCGGLVTLCGILTRSFRSPAMGYTLERIGQTTLAIGFLVHGVSLLVYRPELPVTYVLIIGLAWAAYKRSQRIPREREAVAQVVRDA